MLRVGDLAVRRTPKGSRRTAVGGAALFAGALSFVAGLGLLPARGDARSPQWGRFFRFGVSNGVRFGLGRARHGRTRDFAAGVAGALVLRRVIRVG